MLIYWLYLQNPGYAGRKELRNNIEIALRRRLRHKMIDFAFSVFLSNYSWKFENTISHSGDDGAGSSDYHSC